MALRVGGSRVKVMAVYEIVRECYVFPMASNVCCRENRASRVVIKAAMNGGETIMTCSTRAQIWDDRWKLFIV